MRLQVIFVSIFLLCLGACAQQYSTFEEMSDGMLENTVPVVRAQEIKFLLDRGSNFILLDTREKKEFDVSHIKGATYVGYDDFELESVSQLDKEAKIMVYCSVGYRSERIGEKLQQAGFKNVFNLKGGIFDWANKGYLVYNNKDERTNAVHAYDEDWGKWLLKGEKVYD